MRISSILDDPAFVHDSIYWLVYLDGELLSGYVTADETTGEAFVWVKGSWLSDLPKIERLTGQVHIQRDEGEEVRYAQGTVGLIDAEEGCFVWSEPSHPDYTIAKQRATHFWDHHAYCWYRPSDLVRQ